MDDVEIFSTGASRPFGQRCMIPEDRIGIRIGSEVRTMTAGEWSRLVASPKRFVEAYTAPEADLA